MPEESNSLLSIASSSSPVPSQCSEQLESCKNLEEDICDSLTLISVSQPLDQPDKQSPVLVKSISTSITPQKKRFSFIEALKESKQKQMN